MFKSILVLSVIIAMVYGIVNLFQDLATVQPNVYSIVYELNNKPKDIFSIDDKILVANVNAKR